MMMRTLFFICLVLALPAAAHCADEPRFFGDVIDYGEEYLSPEYIDSDQSSNTLIVGCKTGDKVLILKNDKLAGEIPLGGRVSGVTLAPNGIAYATTLGVNGKLHKLDINAKKILQSCDVGYFPNAPLASKDGKSVYFANQFLHKISKFDAESGKIVKSAKAVHEPYAMALTPDGKKLVVTNHLPAPKGGLYEENIASAVSIYDAQTLENIANIELANGTINCKDVAISPDGKYAFVSHVLARFNVPTTQLERGWINTNAIAIIDLEKNKVLTSFLLDENTAGAANPWGIAFSPDGLTLAVASAGTHEIHLIDYELLFEEIAKPRGPRDPAIEDDLNFLSEIRERIELGGFGPRYIAWLGDSLYAALYYSDTLAKVDMQDGNTVSQIDLGGNTKLNKARLGDLYFNDARMCFQQWLSCATCHPSTRSDNLNWDLVNDGIGNPKQSKSMLFAHFTPPTMITGVRKDGETCVRAGLIYIQFVERSEEDAQCVDAFMKRLKPMPSPYKNPDGTLPELAQEGEIIFETAACSGCHKGEYLTDMKLHDLGTAEGPDEGRPFDTPTLIEVWRSAPYLYDGRAKTIFDMLKRFNKDNRHGNTKDLSDYELKALEAYILTL